MSAAATLFLLSKAERAPAGASAEWVVWFNGVCLVVIGLCIVWWAVVKTLQIFGDAGAAPGPTKEDTVTHAAEPPSIPAGNHGDNLR